MTTPQPFLEPRGTPNSIRQRLLELAALGHQTRLPCPGSPGRRDRSRNRADSHHVSCGFLARSAAGLSATRAMQGKTFSNTSFGRDAYILKQESAYTVLCSRQAPQTATTDVGVKFADSPEAEQ